MCLTSIPTACEVFEHVQLEYGADFGRAFLIFTAHEFRRTEARVRLFREVAGALTPRGQIAVVEHLRDWRNFLVFGPGFWHFLSRRTWLSTAAAAGLHIHDEFSMTPFVRVFLMEKVI